MAKVARQNTNTPHLIGTPEAPEKVVRLTIELPESLVKHYEEQGDAWGRTAEHEMATRLQRCRTYVSTSPLYFTDDERREIEKALGHNCTNPGVVLQQLKNAVSLVVGDVSVELPPRLQQRIRSRVFRSETYEKVITREVIKGLEIFAGMRPA